MKTIAFAALAILLSACAPRPRTLPPLPSPLAQLQATVQNSTPLMSAPAAGTVLCSTVRVKSPMELTRIKFSYDQQRDYQTVELPPHVAQGLTEGVVDGVLHQLETDALAAGWRPLHNSQLPDDSARAQLQTNDRSNPSYVGVNGRCAYMLVVDVNFEHAANTYVAYIGSACRKTDQPNDPTFQFYCYHGGSRFVRVPSSAIASVEPRLYAWDREAGKYSLAASCPRSYGQAAIPQYESMKVQNVRQFHNASTNLYRHSATAAWSAKRCGTASS